MIHGAKLFLDPEVRKRYPALVVFPQCAAEDSWSVRVVDKKGRRKFPLKPEPNPSLGLVMALLDQLIAGPDVDPARVYLSGLSMGGFGTFELLARLPDRFAAAAPICGGGSPRLARRYARTTPVWIFHGAADEVVAPEYSRVMFRKLEQLGAEVKYSEYPGVGHNSWDRAFAETEYLGWMFSKKKK